MASIRRIERMTGLELKRRELHDPLSAEARALLRDASRAANAILTSIPGRPAPVDREPQQAG